MLILLALFKLRSFVDSPMRLRTACSFDLGHSAEIKSKNVVGYKLPASLDLLGSKGQDGCWQGDLPTRIKAAAGEEDDKMRVTQVTFAA